MYFVHVYINTYTFSPNYRFIFHFLKRKIILEVIHFLGNHC